MKWKKFFVILLSLLYFDLIFNLFMYDTYLRESFINIVLLHKISKKNLHKNNSIYCENEYIYRKGNYR